MRIERRRHIQQSTFQPVGWQSISIDGVISGSISLGKAQKITSFLAKQVTY